MTKMKNTKKGMAKKALSISLIAAMLATSNVPVWAAFEAEDPAQISTETPEASPIDAFAADEGVIESAGAESQAVVDDEIYVDRTRAYIGDDVTFTTNVAVDGSNIVEAAINVFRDEIDGTQVATINVTEGSPKIEYTITADDIGHELVARVTYKDENGVWNTTVAPYAYVNVPYDFEQLFFNINGKTVSSSAEIVNICYDDLENLTIEAIDQDASGSRIQLVADQDYGLVYNRADKGDQKGKIVFFNSFTFARQSEYEFNITESKGSIDNTLVTVTKTNGAAWDGQWGTELKANLDTELGNAVSYQWQKCDASLDKTLDANWIDISGATDSKFTPKQDLVKNGSGNDEKDYLLRAKVIYTADKPEEKTTYSEAIAVKPQKVNAEAIKITYETIDQSGKTVTVEVTDKTVLTKEQLPKVTVEVNGQKLNADKNYVIAGFDPSTVGTQNVSFDLSSPYEGKKTVQVSANTVDIKDATFTLAKCDYTYNPEGFVPEVSEVKLGTKVLEAGKDYVVEHIYSDVTEPVRQSDIDGAPDGVPVIIKGIGAYGGTAKGDTAYEKVNVLPANIADNCYIKVGNSIRPADTEIKDDTYGDYFKVYYKTSDGRIIELPHNNNFTIDDGNNKQAEAGMETTVKVKGKAESATEFKVSENFYGTLDTTLTVEAKGDIFSDTTVVEGSQITRGAAFLAEIASAIKGDVYMESGQSRNKVAMDRTTGEGADYSGSKITFDSWKQGNTTYTLNRLKHYVDTESGFKDGVEYLVAGQDYTVTYNNNLNANKYNANPAPSVTIKMLGKYKGERTFYFNIEQKALYDGEVKAKTDLIIFNPLATNETAKTVYSPLDKLILTYNNQTLVEGKDYTNVFVKWVNDEKDTSKGHFEYTLKAHQSQNQDTGYYFDDGNFTGARQIDIDITAKSLLSSDITFADIESQQWTGKAIKPTLKVTDLDGKYTLVEGTDYSVEWKNNVATGTATVTITGIDKRYTDKLQKTFSITSKSLTDGKIVNNYKANTTGDLSAYTAADEVLKNQMYNDGKPVSLSKDFFVVDANNNKLVAGRDYTVSYTDNINVGTATVTVTGIGSYEGTLTATFKIVGQLINGKFDKTVIADQVFTGEEIKPEVKFTPSPLKLEEGKDYEIAYVNNVNSFVATGKEDLDAADYAGPYVVARGIGNYAGQIRLAFNIQKSNLSNSDVTAADAEYAGGQLAHSKITVKNPVSGKELAEGTDYTVSYKSGVNVGDKGEALVTILDTKNYVVKGTNNTLTVNYNIVAKDLKNVEIQAVEDQVVTGEQIKPELVVMNGSVKMTEGVDYEVAYGENKEVGEGTAVIKALDSNKNYVGEQEVKFNIIEDAFKVAVPELSSAVNRNVVSASVKLVDSAYDYDYVLCKSEEDFAAQNYFKYNLSVNENSTMFRFVREGQYYVYARAIKRDEDGKKIYSDWSKPVVVDVTTDTPNAPTVTNVKVNGKNVTVTYTTGARTQGVDVMLGTATRIVDEELRPVTYGKNLVKNVPVKTKSVTFKNVAAGTYYVGVHPYINSSEGLKYFGRWSKQNDITAITVK